MYYAIAPIVGVLITSMNAVNSRFAAAVGGLTSILVIHVVGLCAVSLILALKPEPVPASRPPLRWYAGGFVGVGTVAACNVAYGALGASLASALALFGQTAFSVAADSTGLLGRRKYPLSPRAFPGLAVTAAGIAIMGSRDLRGAAFVPFALLAGVLPALAFILNSRLAGRVGVFRSTRANFAAGLGTLAVASVAAAVWNAVARTAAGTEASGLAESIAGASRAIVSAGPPLVFGGGLMGVIVVTAINVIFPRIPALRATLLLFAGQAAAGLVIDSILLGAVDPRTVLGSVVVVGGLGTHALMTVEKRRFG